MNAVNGGVSRYTRDLLRGIFIDEAVSTSGVVLPLPSGPTTVKINFCALLGDEEALNAMWHIKGASGICPCGVLCSVVNKQRPEDRDLGIKSLSDLDPSIQDISCSDLALCGLRSDDDVWNGCAQLEACDKDAVDELEHSTGLKLNLDTLLFCKELRPYVPPSSTTFDPMHILMSNGLVGSQIMLFMHEMRRPPVGAYFADVRAFHQEGKWMPKSVAAFTESREKSSHDTLKAGASELLLAYPLLRAFIHATYGDNAPEPHVVVILLLFQICDLVRLLITGCSGAEAHASARRMEVLVKSYLAAFVKAYGRDAVRFKHHQLLHLPRMIMRLGRMLSCWVTERKNLCAKASMQHTKRDDHSFEVATLSRMLNAQVRMLQEPGWCDALGAPTTSFPELALDLRARSVDLARDMKYHGVKFRSGDFSFMDIARTYLVAVVGCVKIDGPIDMSFGLLVRCCRRVSGTEVTSTWDVDPAVSLYRLGEERFLKPAFHRYITISRVELLH